MNFFKFFAVFFAISYVLHVAFAIFAKSTFRQFLYVVAATLSVFFGLVSLQLM